MSKMMAAMRVSRVLAAIACIVLAIVTAANASKFEESIPLTDGKRVGPIVEGPMYAVDGGFVGFVTGKPYVAYKGTAVFPGGTGRANLHANLTIYHTSSKTILPVFDTTLSPNERKANSTLINCDSARGMPTRDVMEYAFGKLEGYQVIDLAANAGPTAIDFESEVVETGYQHIIFILCRRHHKEEIVDIDVAVQGTLLFRNPYGFLPAKYYGFLPFLGILSSLYFGMFLMYGYLSLRYRKTMLRMQWGVLAVILMGVIESTTWFLTYVVMNDTGETSCCPWQGNIVFAMFAKNLKQTVSGMLVLAVALGWGVVRSSLTRKLTFAVICLGVFYLAFSVKFDLVRMDKISHTSQTNDNDENDPDAVVETASNNAFWAFPVALCDVVFILAIYFGLVDTSQHLENDHQEAKLEMYQRLTGTLRLWGILWFLFTLFDLTTRVGLIPWPWTLEFLLWSFWDVLYLGVLLRIAVIWRPTETSDKYAYSTQLPTEHVLDEFETPEFEENSIQREAELTKINAQKPKNDADDA